MALQAKYCSQTLNWFKIFPKKYELNYCKLFFTNNVFLPIIVEDVKEYSNW